MSPTDIALLVRPFAALVLFALIVAPLAMLVKRMLPEGRVKRFLLKYRW